MSLAESVVIEEPGVLGETALSSPKYQSVHDALLLAIEGLPAGTAMPTERELCTTYGVSPRRCARRSDNSKSNNAFSAAKARARSWPAPRSTSASNSRATPRG